MNIAQTSLWDYNEEQPIESELIEGKRHLLTKSQVTVETTLGFDNVPDQWIRVLTIGSTNDTIRYQIDGGAKGDVTITQTAAETDILLLARKIVSDLNADALFRTYWVAKFFNEVVHISAIQAGEYYSAADPDDVLITITGTITIEQNSTHDRIIRRNKVALSSRDIDDPRIGVIGVQGEVSSVLKSTNPIDFNIRKIIAASSEQLFIDKDVPSDERWFIPDIFFGSTNNTEIKVYKGYDRDHEETIIGTTADEYQLEYEAVPKPAGNWTVTVNGSPETNFHIEDDPTDDKKSLLVWDGVSGALNGDTIVVTYDAVDRILSSTTPANDGQTIAKQVPIRLEPSTFIIVTIQNTSANAARTSVTLSGYYEEVLI